SCTSCPPFSARLLSNLLGVEPRDPARRRLAPWLVELVRNVPGLVGSYRPGAALDPRTRERVILAVTDVNGCRYSAWVHGSWQAFLGDGDHGRGNGADGRLGRDDDDAMLDYARACAEAGAPLGAAPLAGVVAPDAIGPLRA